jgi:hypothetical protein
MSNVNLTRGVLISVEACRAYEKEGSNFMQHLVAKQKLRTK